MMNSGRRAFLKTVGLGVVAHLIPGTLVNLISGYPLYYRIMHGTLGEPLPLHALFVIVGGLLALPIDFFVAFRFAKSASDERAALLGGAGVSLLAHAIGGFINGTVTFLVLLVVFQIVIGGSGSSGRGLAESYYGLLSLVIAAGLLVSWIVGSLLSAGVGAVGGGMGRGRASPKQ